MNNNSSRQFPSRLLVISSCVAFTSGRTRAANSQGFPFQNGSDDLHAAHAPEVAQYIAELYIHLRPDVLHTLNHAARLANQVGPLPPKTTRHPDFVRRLKTVIQQPKSVQLQQPLTLLNVALASGHILRMLRIHQIYFQALLFENLEYRHPPGRRWRTKSPRCWPPSAAQTWCAVFPRHAFTKARASALQWKVLVSLAAPTHTRHTACASAAASSHSCASICTDATKCAARSSCRVC